MTVVIPKLNDSGTGPRDLWSAAKISDEILSAVGGTAVLNKLNATAAPTANDDSANTSGNGVFSVGSTWIDTTGDEAYRLVDATPTAAVWVLMTLDIAQAAALFVNVTGDTMTGALAFSGTNHAGVKLISLTTAQRLALTPGVGMLVYDTTLGKYMAYGTAGWFEIDGGAFNVKSFGAVGNGETDDSGAINAAWAALRATKITESNNSRVPNYLFIPPGVYLTNSSLDCTDLVAWNVHIIAHGAIIVGKCTGKAVVDMTAVRGLHIHGLDIYGDATNTPSCGILLGPENTDTCGNNRLDDVKIQGYFSVTAAWNIGSETTQYEVLYT